MKLHGMIMIFAFLQFIVAMFEIDSSFVGHFYEFFYWMTLFGFLTFASATVYDKYPNARFTMNSVYRFGFGLGLLVAALWFQFAILHQELNGDWVKWHFVLRALVTMGLAVVSFLKFKQFME